MEDVAGDAVELPPFSESDRMGFLVQSLSKEKVNVLPVAKKYRTPEQVASILVGDRKAIRGPVSGLNAGPVRSMAIEDVLGKAPVFGDSR